MRLIDADALRTDFQERLKNCDEWIAKVANDHDLLTRAQATRDFICEVLMTINDSPTVELRLMKVDEGAGHTLDYAMGWKACIEWIKNGVRGDV